MSVQVNQGGDGSASRGKPGRRAGFIFVLQACLRNLATGGRRLWMIFIPLLGSFGFASTFAYISQVPANVRWTAFGTALVVALAAAVAGGIVGFLFGIPLTNQNGSQGGAAGTNPYKANTNLEQVSDWLVKIIVGVGLVQIGHVLPALSRLARSLKAPLGNVASSQAFGLALVIYFALLGFLLLYLWSREILPDELPGGVAAVIQHQIDSKIDSSDSARSAALDLIDQQLNAGRGGVSPAQDALNKAVSDAPDSTRLLIFIKADEYRRELGERIRISRAGHPEDTDWYQRQMKLAIPVFRALIAADTQNQDYRNHGSLGFALKDSAGPVSQDSQTWAQAVSELTKAIEIRDRRQINGWRLYEANRAVCNIQLYGALPPDDPQAADLAARIEADLAAVHGDRYAESMTNLSSTVADPSIRQWRAGHPQP